jgi:ABC-type glycerol-3-phosphate transport system substrate-binding protein
MEGAGTMLKRNWVVVLMILTLASISFLSACSSSSPSNSTASDTTANGTTATPANKDPLVVNILLQDGGNKYAQQVKPGDVYYQEMSKMLTAYTGRPATVNIEMLDHNTYGQLLAVRFASGNIPDVWWTTRIDDPAHPKAVSDGVILQLNDLIDKYGPNIKKNVPESAWTDPKLSKDGKIYALPKMAPAPNIAVLLYRKDWLDKLGLKEPQTLDDYLAYFAAVKATDLNGNGIHDEIGYIMRKDMMFSEAFFGYFGAYPGTWQYVNGQFIPDIINPKMKDAVAFYKKLYDNGYINKDFLTTTTPDWTKLKTSDKAAMWSHQSLDLINGDDPATFADPNDVKVYPLPGPKNAQGKINYTPEATGVNAVYAISSKAKHPEDIIKFFDWMWSDDTAKNNFLNFGIENKNYTVANGKIVWSPNAKENTDLAVKGFYQTMINLSKDVRLSDIAVGQSSYQDVVKLAEKYASENTFKDESVFMPVPSNMKTHPELGDKDGSLFMDMFAKVVTGKEPIDTAFNKFVTDWKSRGGDQAIKEATDWYKAYYKK